MNTNHGQRESQGLCEHVAFLVPSPGPDGKRRGPCASLEDKVSHRLRLSVLGAGFLSLNLEDVRWTGHT